MLRREIRWMAIGLFFFSAFWPTGAFSQGTAWEQQIEAGRKASARGQYDEAAKMFTAALEEAQKSGKQDARLGTSLTELGLAYSAHGKYGEAESVLQRAVSVKENVLGLDHVDVGRALVNLGDLYRLKEEPAKAEPPIRRALDILEKALGLEHPEVASALTNLAGRLRDLRKYAEAEPLLQRSLAIREKILKSDHPDLVRTLLGFASLYTEQGKYAEAEPFLQRSLTILEKIQAYGTAYPNAPDVLVRYADLLRKTNRDAEAVKMEARAKELRERSGR